MLDYSLEAIIQEFAIPVDWTFHIKKQINLKHEKEGFYKNDQEMLDWIDERYEGCTKKLLQSYDITLFEKDRDRKVLQALAIILGKKIQIEVDEAMMRIAFNIIEAHICYNFPTFIPNEMRKIFSK